MQKKNICKDKYKNCGKPSGIKTTKLLIPQIWTNLYECSQVVKLLIENSRHISVHKAGKDSGKKTRKDAKTQIKENAEFYEIAQEVALQLFKIPILQKRLIIFFFRLPSEENIPDLSDFNIKDQKLAMMLQRSYFLFNKSFIGDLVRISESQNSGEDFVSQMANSGIEPEYYSQFFQNAYITHIINDMIKTKSANKYEEQRVENLKTDFLKFVNLDSTKKQVLEFINQLTKIYYDEHQHHQYQYQQEQYITESQPCELLNLDDNQIYLESYFPDLNFP